MTEVGKLAEEDKTTYEKSASSTVTSRKWLMTIVGLGSVVLIILSGYFIGKTISDPLHHIASRLKDISEGEGDLTKTVDAHVRSEC